MNSLSLIVGGYNPLPLPWWSMLAAACLLLALGVISYLQKAKVLDRDYDPEDPLEFPDPADDPNRDPEDWN